MKIDTITNTIQKITAFDQSARFVGSVALNYHGVENANDIDVLTNDIDLYDQYLVKKWVKSSLMSKNGKRATARIDGIIIDLFEVQESEDTNEYEDVNGGKLQTLISLLKFHQSLITSYLNQEPSLNRDVHIEKINKKINKLLNIIFT